MKKIPLLFDFFNLPCAYLNCVDRFGFVHLVITGDIATIPAGYILSFLGIYLAFNHPGMTLVIILLSSTIVAARFAITSPDYL